MRSVDKSVNGMVVGVVCSACRVDPSHLDTRTLTNGSKSNIHGHRCAQIKGADIGLVAHVGPTGCMIWHCVNTVCTIACAKRECS